MCKHACFYWPIVCIRESNKCRVRGIKTMDASCVGHMTHVITAGTWLIVCLYLPCVDLPRVGRPRLHSLDLAENRSGRAKPAQLASDEIECRRRATHRPHLPLQQRHKRSSSCRQQLQQRPRSGASLHHFTCTETRIWIKNLHPLLRKVWCLWFGAAPIITATWQRMLDNGQRTNHASLSACHLWFRSLFNFAARSSSLPSANRSAISTDIEKHCV